MSVIIRLFLVMGFQLVFLRWADAHPTVPFFINRVPVESLSWTSDGKTLEISEYNEADPPSLEFSGNFSGKNCLLGKFKCGGGQAVSLFFGKIGKTFKPKVYKLSYVLNGETKTFKIQLLPSNILQLKISGRSSISQPIVFSAREMSKNRSQLFVIGPEGELRYFKALPYDVSDFRPHIIEGQDYFSYEKAALDLRDWSYHGTRVILNRRFEVVKTISGDFDPHEFHLFDLDHFMVLETPLKRLKSGILYADRRVREYDHGKRVFDWGLSDFMEELGWPPVLGAYLHATVSEAVTELMHLNSVQLIDRDRLLVSMGSNGVVCVDRKTKKILWVFGGLSDQFGLTNDEQLVYVHTPVFDPSTDKLTVFKNSKWNENQENLTSALVVEYQLDLAQKKVIHSRVIRGGNEQTLVRGSVQISENQVYSINYGTHDLFHQDTFIERKGDQDQMSIRVLSKNIEIYRIYRSPFGTPP